MADLFTRFEIRLPHLLAGKIDEWRRRQRDLPNRAEAARRLIEQGLNAPGSSASPVNEEDGAVKPAMVHPIVWNECGWMDKNFQDVDKAMNTDVPASIHLKLEFLMRNQKTTKRALVIKFLDKACAEALAEYGLSAK